MKISHIKISNILGIKSLEFSPNGALTEITGQNGEGKTSVLEAIKAATGGGHDATLLRRGEEKGEIVLVLDDGTEIQKRVTADKSTVDVKRDGKKVASPANHVKALIDALSVNPVEFLTARKQDRVRVLLESMPIELDIARLQELAGVPVQQGPGVHAFTVIETVRKEVYDNRALTNRAVKEKESTINQLTVALPPAPGGVEGDEAEMQTAIDQARAKKDAELKRVEEKITGIRNDHQKQIDKIRQDSQAKLDQIREEAQTAIDAVKTSLAGIETKANQQREKVTNEFNTSTQPLQLAIANVRENRDAVARRKVTQQNIADMTQHMQELADDAEKQTQAIEAIDQYKSDLLDNLPIPGVEVIDGEVFRDGIPFDRLNTAQQVGIAVEIAKLRAGDLAVCCIDNFELLDPEALKEFCARAEESSIQFFITRVTGEKFSVTTD